MQETIDRLIVLRTRLALERDIVSHIQGLEDADRELKFLQRNCSHPMTDTNHACRDCGLEDI